MKRPTGVTVIAVVAFLGGLWQFLMAFSYFGVRIPMFTVFGGVVGGTVSALTFTVAGASLLFAVLGFVFAIGALRLQPWAWTLGLVLYWLDVVAAFALLLTLGSAAVVGAAVAALVAAIIIGYLYTNPVREAFGHERGHAATTGTHGPSPA